MYAGWVHLHWRGTDALVGYSCTGEVKVYWLGRDALAGCRYAGWVQMHWLSADILAGCRCTGKCIDESARTVSWHRPVSPDPLSSVRDAVSKATGIYDRCPSTQKGQEQRQNYTCCHSTTLTHTWTDRQLQYGSH